MYQLAKPKYYKMKKLTLLFLISCWCLFTYSQQDLSNLNIDGQACSLHGTSKEGSKEYDLNPLKNRFNFPTKQDFDNTITLQNLISREAIKGKFLQNKAVEITGYVFNVKKGGTETCNCKTTDPLFMDTHIELTPNSTETGADKRLIVEVTPRIRELLEGQGTDWSTETLVSKLKGHLVKIQGWLFYDEIHEPQAFSTNPDNASGRNWRASCWEIHPITSIEILDPEEGMATEENFPSSATAFTSKAIAPVSFTNNSSLNTSSMSTPSTPLNTLIIILIGAILGAVGQGMRVIVGMKKVYDEAMKNSTPAEQLIEYRQITFSLIIGFAIGGVAGVLAAVSSDHVSFSDKSVVIAFITAGYAGTDFIEGFIKKYPNVSGNAGKGGANAGGNGGNAGGGGNVGGGTKAEGSGAGNS